MSIVTATVAVDEDDRTAGRADSGIERAEAEELLKRAVRLTQVGDFTGLCQTVAAALGQCRMLLDYTRSEDWLPGSAAPVVLYVRRYPASRHRQETLVLHVAGVRADQSRYETDFPVMQLDRGLRSMAPVYWSGMTFDGSYGVCDQLSEGTCAQENITPPGPKSNAGSAT